MKPLFILEGKVSSGKKRGKDLGFPTINFPLSDTIPEGIYISQIKITGVLHSSLTFIGSAKTYDETSFQAETYVLDFAQDVYGQSVTVYILKKIRDNQKFATEKKLIEQMEKDKQLAEQFFAKHNQ